MFHLRSFIVLLLALTAPSILAAQLPKEETLRSKIRAEHPRLLLTAADLETLRQQVSQPGEAADWFAKIRESADQMLSEPPSKYEIPDGLRLLGTSRTVKERAFTLGLTFQLTRDRKYADRLWKELEAAARFKDWNPRHFLDTAEMTNAFAIGYDWLYADWTPEQRAELRSAIVEKGLKTALPFYHKHEWWTVSHFNWNQVCNGGIGMGALALLDEEPKLGSEILRAAIESLPLAMQEFAPDGAWGEGPGYWGYASEYNVYFLAALRTAVGEDFGLSQIAGFSKAGEFPPYFTGPTGQTFNYADAGAGFKGAPQLFWLARAFQSPDQAAFQLRYAAAKPRPLDLIWGAWWLQHRPAEPSLPLDRHFHGSEVVSMRSSWKDPKALWVAVKGGNNAVNHSHLDLGSFVMDALGERWVADLGSDDYNMPGYFGKQRWSYYRLRAEGQNTLVINPGLGPDQAPTAVAPVRRFAADVKKPFTVIDLTSAYQDAQKIERGIALLDRREVLVQDEIKMAKPSEIWWFLHTPAKIEISADGTLATFHLGTSTMKAQILSPSGAAFESRKSEPLPSSPHPVAQAEHGHSNAGFSVLAIHLQSATATTLRVLLTPDDGKPASKPGTQALAEW